MLSGETPPDAPATSSHFNITQSGNHIRLLKNTRVLVPKAEMEDNTHIEGSVKEMSHS